MTNKTLIVAAASALLAASADAALVSRWNFNGRSMSATTGSGSAQLVGTDALGFTYGTTHDGSSSALNRAIRMAGFSPMGSQSGRRGIEFQTDTSGYQFLSIAFSVSGQRRSSAWGQLQYSTDGGATFTSENLERNGRFSLRADGAFRRIGFSLELVDGASDSNDFRFRIVAVSDPNLGRFRAVSGATVLGDASWKVDGVTVRGTEVDSNIVTPAPGAIALVGMAGLLSASRRRT